MRLLLARLARYGVTGGAAAVVDAGGFEVLLRAGMGVVAAGTLSFCIAAVVNYWLTSRFVFGKGKTVAGFALFFVFAVVGLTVNMGVTLAAIYWLGLIPVLAKILGIGTAFLINFALNAGIVFRDRR